MKYICIKDWDKFYFYRIGEKMSIGDIVDLYEPKSTEYRSYSDTFYEHFITLHIFIAKKRNEKFNKIK